MNVISIRLDIEKLKQLPDKERAFFIGLGHISNEINALTKMMYWAANAPERNDAEINGQKTLILLLMKILAGKLLESWNFFKTAFFSTGISKIFDPELDGEPKEALEKIKKYFGNSNKVSTIRNNFSFHYSPNEVDDIIGKIDADIDLYMEKDWLPNNLFYFAELLEAAALVEAIDYDVQVEDIDEVLSNLTGELFDVGQWFLVVSDGLMNLIVAKFGEEMRIREPQKIRFGRLRKFKKVSLPWFTQVRRKR
jgi:hypothetical protein